MKNSQKGFANTILLVVIVAIVVIGGYFVLSKKSTTPIAQQPTSTTQTSKDVWEKDARRVGGMEIVMSALISYYKHNKSCPDTLTNLVPTSSASLVVLPNQEEAYQYAYTQDKLNCHLGVTLESVDPSLLYDIERTGTAPWKGCNSSINNGCFSTTAVGGFDGTNPKMYNKILSKKEYGALFILQQNSTTFSAVVIDSGFTNIEMNKGTFQSISPSNLSDAIKKGILYTTTTTDFLQFNSSRPHVISDYLPLGKVKIDGYFETAVGNGIITRVEQLK